MRMNLNLWKSPAPVLAALAALSAAPSPAPCPQEPEYPPVLFYWINPTLEEAQDTAWPLVRQMENHMRVNHFEDYPARVFTEAWGAERTVHWFVPFADLADRFRVEPIVHGDEGWKALLARQEGAFDLEQARSYYLVHLGGLAPKKSPRQRRWLRITYSAPTKMPLAERFVRDVMNHLEASYDGIDAHAYTADFQDPSAIFWMIDYDTPESWTAFRAKLQADDAYVEMFERAEGLFLEDRTSEVMIRD